MYRCGYAHRFKDKETESKDGDRVQSHAQFTYEDMSRTFTYINSTFILLQRNCTSHDQYHRSRSINLYVQMSMALGSILENK